MFWAVTTRSAEMAITAARIPKKICSATTGPSSLLRTPLGLGTDLEGGRVGNGGHPFAQPRLVVEEIGDVDLGVLVLRAPEQRVEWADLDADAAVHAQAVVDVEPVEE